jgi:haloacetate dehalogenase
MTDLPELFRGFESRLIDVGGDVEIFCRIGGEGPPLVLLHGYPQTHACWRRVAARLAGRFQLILPDLRGYGRSSAPPPAPHGANYAKREMANDVVRLMETLGHERFALAGHDRGARVGYRLALDHPGSLTRLAVLDIVPTAEMWAAMDARMAISAYHWAFLAQAAPLPETLISADPMLYLERTLGSWSASGLEAFDEASLAHYRAFFAEPARVAATCGDYRAGASVDVSHDASDRESARMIDVPVLALWGERGFPGQIGSPLEIWRTWAHDVQGRGLPCGHFLPEEAPAETAEALLAFFGEAA